MGRYGQKCQFAHGEEELRFIPRHPKYKTELCQSFHKTGTCRYGTRCRFIHNESEAQNRRISPRGNTTVKNNARTRGATVPQQRIVPSGQGSRKTLKRGQIDPSEVEKPEGRLSFFRKIAKE